MKPFKPLIIFALATLVTLSLSRVLLVIWNLERVPDAAGVYFILLQGLRFDLVLLGILLGIPAVLTPLVSLQRLALPAWNLGLRAYLVLCFGGLLFVELATPSFIDQYDLRPNYIFIEYLKYPREVFATLWSAYRLPLLAALSVTVIASWVLNRMLEKHQLGGAQSSWPKALVMTPMVFLLCLGMARSTLDHRPVNPSTVAFSTDPLVNTLPLSSAYTVLYALSESFLDDFGESPYGDMAADRAVELVRLGIDLPEAEFTDVDLPTLHRQKAYVHRDRKPNLVIVLEESLGADYVGSLGGMPLTPALDRLSGQGIWFENMYATGTRSVRGIEAVITGFTPMPSRSVVKLGKSQTGFFTIARLLSDHGYDTSFIYGGEAQFDNMGRFFANNGFKTIIDEKDYRDPAFYGSWGASDEDLFEKAHQTFDAYGDDQAFFSLVFTSSNHSPFDFPDDRISLRGTEKNTVENAVLYADYALGKFIDRARHSKYWENTLFVIVADHSDKVFGTEPVPVKRFHIPALILGADVPPTSYSPVASQIDLLPTLLSLMGIDSEHPAVGRDLARNILERDASGPGRAIMQFGSSQAYMKGDRVVILQKDKAPGYYAYDHQRLVPAGEQDDALGEEALAHALWSMHAYNRHLYGLPEGSHPLQ